jgi:uncharacterized protein YggU (UPF0235/DUF167 family)
VSQEADLRPLFREARGALHLRIKVVPGASRDRVVGVHGDALKLAVTAAPMRGLANDAVRQLLAAALDLPIAAVEITRGHGSAHKHVALRGLDLAAAAARMATALS